MKKSEGGHEVMDVEHPDVNFEPKDVNVRIIMYIGIGFIIAAIIIQALVWWIYDYFRQRDAYKGRLSATEIQETVSQPPEPRLQVNPATDLQALKSSQREQLNSYGWVDQPNGIARIPIEQAMKYVAQKGLPVSKAQANQSATPGNTMQSSGTNAGNPGEAVIKK